MQWISKEQPIYIFLDDTWLSEKDKKVFKPNIELQCWECEEEKIYWTKKTKIMKYRDINELD